MKDICILVPNGDNNLSSIAGSYKILSRAGEIWQKRCGDRPYTIRVIGSAPQASFHDGLFAVNPHASFAEIHSPYLVIIPSLNHNYAQALAENAELVSWLKTCYASGAQIASICTGAFLLAETGLLDGKSCSTHWSAAADFRQLYPNVKLETDRLITDENGIYTNGGAFSFLNLIIYLIEKLYDRETAIVCSKIFQVEPDRTEQSPFIIFSGQKAHDDEVVIRAQQYMEENIGARISVADLSEKFNVGRRNFDRRFYKATGNSPLEYAQRIKIEAVKKGLETTRRQVSELMYDVGYSDTKAFREVFRKFTGLSPLEYRSRYNNNW